MVRGAAIGAALSQAVQKTERSVETLIADGLRANRDADYDSSDIPGRPSSQSRETETSVRVEQVHLVQVD